MPVAIKLKVFGTVNGALTKSVTDLTVDYADGPSLPTYIKWNEKVWEKTNQNGTNYQPWPGVTIVDIEAEGKIIEV